MKKWFHRWNGDVPGVVASENHYASFRVPRNNACARIYGRGGRECVRDSSHHKSIMAISAAIKSLRIGWIRNKIVLTYVNRSASSFLFFVSFLYVIRFTLYCLFRFVFFFSILLYYLWCWFIKLFLSSCNVFINNLDCLLFYRDYLII